MTLALLSAIAGAVALGLLVWRLLTTWDEIGLLARALGATLLIGTVGGTLNAYALAYAGKEAANTAGPFILLATRVLTIAVCLTWPRLVRNIP